MRTESIDANSWSDGRRGDGGVLSAVGLYPGSQDEIDSPRYGRRTASAKGQFRAAAQVLLVNGAAHVIDCGDGVARQLVLASVPLPTLPPHLPDPPAFGSQRRLRQSDLARVGGRFGTRVDAWGPPPLDRMTRLFFEMNAYDIETRIADEGRVPLVPLVHAHELTRGGVVMQDENVKVTAALVGIHLWCRHSAIVSTRRTAPSSSRATPPPPTI